MQRSTVSQNTGTVMNVHVYTLGDKNPSIYSQFGCLFKKLSAEFKPFYMDELRVKKPSLIFTGSNMHHHLTERIIRENFTDERFFYVHIDAHRDYMNPLQIPKPEFYAFVQHIAKLECCQGVAMVGNSALMMKEYLTEIKENATVIDDTLNEKKIVLAENFKGIKNISQGDIYLSLDLDVLKRSYMETPYSSQGSMEFEELLMILRHLTENNSIIGADICGLPDKPTKEELIRVEELSDILINGISLTI